MVKNRKDSSSLSRCGQCLKYIMFACNIAFFLLACAVMAVGIVILVDKNYVSLIFDNALITSSVICIMAGCLGVMVISSLGCCGAVKENKCLLGSYLIALVPIFLFFIAGAVLAIVYRSQIGDEVREFMRTSLRRDYGVRLEVSYHQSITEAWDKAQEKLHCCSVENHSWGVYRYSAWYKEQPKEQGVKPLVPLSCCKRDESGQYLQKVQCQTWDEGPPGLPAGPLNVAVHYKGCYEAGKDYFYDMSAYLIAMGLVLAVIMVIGTVFTLMLCRML